MPREARGSGCSPQQLREGRWVRKSGRSTLHACSCSRTTGTGPSDGLGVEKEEEKTGSEGGREGHDRENTATLRSPWPDEKVISELTFVGPALHFGKAGHRGSRGRLGVHARTRPPLSTVPGTGPHTRTVSHGHLGRAKKRTNC